VTSQPSFHCRTACSSRFPRVSDNMEALAFNRVTAWHGASRSAQRGRPGNTTERWQDKGARGALAVGRVISRGYLPNSRCATVKRSLRQQRSPNKFNVFARCAGLQP
jgi:hypothetical protein